MESPTVASHTPEQQDNSAIVSFYLSITLGLLGVIGNAFVCLVMLRYPKVFNSTTNRLIIHQSVVDLLSSIVFLLRKYLVITTVPDTTLGSLYCRLWWSDWPQYGMFVTSTYNLVAISIERYIATCHPVSHRNLFSTSWLKLIMVAAWMSGWITQAHLIPNSFRVDDACNLSWSNPALQAVVGIFIFLLELIIPLAVIIFTYSKIIVELHRRSKVRAGDNNQDARNMLSKANKNVTKTLLLVAVFFAICWIPADVSYLIFNLGLNVDFVDSTVNVIMGAMVVVNICVNPFIYCFTYERFQKQAKKMVFGTCVGSVNRVGATDAQGDAIVSVINPTANTNA